jgi:hypothetical protein
MFAIFSRLLSPIVAAPKLGMKFIFVGHNKYKISTNPRILLDLTGSYGVRKRN